ncbi:MAG TPA: aminotransferase class I/II-fold pyridoxal phosphate-dependent enzyme [Pseudomonadales bacterium]|nr:aminotransferase class I/II-fold pyridoxal phosphate-dependent enzyme [Pseudomonadales bacterium]
MTRSLAQRLQTIQPFFVMDVLAKAQALQAAGRDVIHLEVGEPDFPTPAPIVAAAQHALSVGHTRYTPALGLPQLREKIAEFYWQRYQVKVDPRQVVVTSGASGALLLLNALLFDADDEVILPDPCYPCNRHFLSLVGARAKLIPTEGANNFALSDSALKGVLSQNSKALMLASPNNPTGTILSKASLEKMARFCRESNLHLVLDEIYHGLVYEADCPSILQVERDAFVINSFSKYFGMTGWRLGWIVAPLDTISELDKLAQNFFIAPSTIAQHAALAAFSDESIAIMEAQREELKKRRDFLLANLPSLGFKVEGAPQGAFYVYADISGLKHPQAHDSLAFCGELLEKSFVAITPGLDFGFYQAGSKVRFAYTAPIPRLEEGLGRMRKLWT